MVKDEQTPTNQETEPGQRWDLLPAEPSFGQPGSAEKTALGYPDLPSSSTDLDPGYEDLQRAYHRLELARNRYADLFDFAPVGYFVFDKNGLIVEVNRTGAGQLGVEKNLLLKQPFSRYVVPENQGLFYQHLQQVYQNRARQINELKLVDSRGHQFYGHLESIFLPDSEGYPDHCRTAVIDVTEHRWATEALRKSETFSRDILNAMSTQIAVLNRQGEVLIVNEAWKESSFPADPAVFPARLNVGANYLESCLQATGKMAATANQVAAGLQKVLHGALSSFSLKYPYSGPFTGPRWFLLTITPLPQGRPGGAVVAYVDITEPKQAEEILPTGDTTSLRHEIAVFLAEISGLVNRNLSKSELFNQLLFSLQVMVTYDSAALFLIEDQEMVIEAGRGFETSLIGQRFSLAQDRLTQEMRKRKSYILIEDTLADRRYQRWAGAAQVRSWMGAPLWVDNTFIGCLTVDRHQVQPFTAEEAELVQAFAYQAAQAIFTIRLISSLKEAQAQLVSQERLAALGQMAATVAHEIRNPLMGLRMGIEYFLRELAETDQHQRGAALTQSNIDRIDRIVEDILFVGRAPKPTKKPTYIRPIIEEELARWTIRLTYHKVKLQLNLEPDLPPLTIDADQIGRAISNLIANSLDALPSGGELKLALYGEGAHQIFTLTDTGPGINSERLEHIFEPFFTTKTRGTGLGLSIVKQIIDQHQGRLEVSSQLGAGTQFKIILPG